mgnify:CR=1 FL=1
MSLGKNVEVLEKEVNKSLNQQKEIQGAVIQVVCSILKVETQDIELNNDMTEYGLDSIGFTELSNQLNIRYHLDLTPAVLFEFTTFDDLVDYLNENYADRFTSKKQTLVKLPEQNVEAITQPVPAITSLNPWVWSDNTEKYGDTCPVSNIWQLTDPEWKGRVSIPDPLLRNETMFWFNQMETHDDDAMAAAYRDHYGSDLPADAESATSEWVKRFAANSPNVTRKDSEVGPVVGTPGLEDPHFGFVSTSIYRAKYGYEMGICGGMKPYAGQLTPRVAVIASGTDSPNAAKLFVHYMMRGEGMTPQLIDGKMATNVDTSMPAEEGSGVSNYVDQLHVTVSATTDQDFAKLLDWQDLWTIHSR